MPQLGDEIEGILMTMNALIVGGQEEKLVNPNRAKGTVVLLNRCHTFPSTFLGFKSR
jgi:hypothetical protein